MNRALMLLVAGLTLGSITSAFGQQSATPSPSDAIARIPAVQLLSSNVPSRLAWGAYLAASTQQNNLIPAIIPLLRFADAGVQLAAIDALIRLNADVPEADLAAYLATNPLDPVLVLLARNPQKHGDFLLQLLARPLSVPNWVAVNGVLSMAAPQGYAERLFRDWHLQYNIELWGKGQYPGPGPTDTSGCAFGCATYHTPATPDGFPPQSLYVISQGPWGSALKLAGGPHPLVYQVFTTADYGPGMDRLLTDRDKDTYTADYLRALMGGDPQGPSGNSFPPTQDLILEWAGAAQFSKDAESFIRSIRAAVDAFRRALIDHHLLTGEEAAAGPKLNFVVVDHRAIPRDALPIIDLSLDH